VNGLRVLFTSVIYQWHFLGLPLLSLFLLLWDEVRRREGDGGSYACELFCEEDVRGYLWCMLVSTRKAKKKNQRERQKKKKQKTPLAIPKIRSCTGSVANSIRPFELPRRTQIVISPNNRHVFESETPRQDNGNNVSLLVPRPKCALDQTEESNNRIAHSRPPINILD
jgi:hypothetical protein